MGLLRRTLGEAPSPACSPEPPARGESLRCERARSNRKHPADVRSLTTYSRRGGGPPAMRRAEQYRLDQHHIGWQGVSSQNYRRPGSLPSHRFRQMAAITKVQRACKASRIRTNAKQTLGRLSDDCRANQELARQLKRADYLAAPVQPPSTERPVALVYWTVPEDHWGRPCAASAACDGRHRALQTPACAGSRTEALPFAAASIPAGAAALFRHCAAESCEKGVRLAEFKRDHFISFGSQQARSAVYRVSSTQLLNRWWARISFSA